MQELNCAKCGANLKFDPIAKKIVCPFCGREEVDEVTIEMIDQAIENDQFGKASRYVVEMRKLSDEPDPKLTLRSAYCSFQSKSLSELLTKNPKDTSYFEKILNHDSFKKLEEELPEEKKVLVKKIDQYSRNSISILTGMSDRAKKRQIEKVQKEGKMAKLPSLKNAVHESGGLWVLVVTAVVVALFVAIAYNDDRGRFNIENFIAIFLFTLPATLFISLGLGQFFRWLSNEDSSGIVMDESAWKQSADGGKDKLMTEEEIETLENANADLLSKIEELEKEVR
ncbi:MAG: hypothetical protein J5607_02985 [Clostridiales bacterium]|nr:hypothetical protein [Clostridiales bacterium]